MNKLTYAALLAVAVLAAGCGSSETASGGTATATTASTTGSTTPKTEPVSSPDKKTEGSTADTAFTPVGKILTANCASCHGANKPKAGISLVDYAGVMKGGKEGVIVSAGKPDESPIVMALKGTGGKKQMPPGKKLSDADLATIEGWIKDGAKA